MADEEKPRKRGKGKRKGRKGGKRSAKRGASRRSSAKRTTAKRTTAKRGTKRKAAGKLAARVKRLENRADANDSKWRHNDSLWNNMINGVRQGAGLKPLKNPVRRPAREALPLQAFKRL